MAALKKLTAARYAWPIRKQAVPTPHRKYSTWGEWFAVMFGENLVAFRDRIKKEA